MASLRRTRTMPTDGAISKFLYTIMKQLDLKSIDWQLVADQLDITNGHAARMRYSRFKQQMEGIPTTPRRARSAVSRPKKAKPDKSKKPEKLEEATKEEQQGAVKEEPGFKLEPVAKIEPFMKEEPFVKAEPDGMDESMYGIEDSVKAEPVVKDEPIDEGAWMNTEGGVDIGGIILDPAIFEQGNFVSPNAGAEGFHASSPGLFIPKQEPVVKMEPIWEH